MKKVFLLRHLSLLSLSGYRLIIAGSTPRLSQAEQQGKMKSKGSMTNGSRSATGKSSKRSNVAQTPVPRLIKERQRQQRIRKLVRINWTPKPLRTKNAIKVMKMSYVA